ncbi:MAG: hypothetical protein KAT58_06500 [candidate division Zixibacteria bacterium]|nr:hypothetical protein [candidate division Zixibacteria bacterium]
MTAKWTDREEQAFTELVERLRFWGYSVPAGEKLFDPALLLMLKTFAYHTVATEDKLAEAGEAIIDSLIADFFVTGLKRPTPAFTMLSCECVDKTGLIDTDAEFVCHLPGIEKRDYSFFPLYPQSICKVNADIVLYDSPAAFRVLRASSDEAATWEKAIDAPEYSEQKRSREPLLGGTIYIGVTLGLPIAEIEALPLYAGPEWQSAWMLNWLDWQVTADSGYATPFKPGKYHDRLEIFKHLDIRELEVDANFRSRLYSSDFLTSGKLLWHFKHYLAPARCFIHIPAEELRDVCAVKTPPDLPAQREHLDFDGLKSPRLWFKAVLPPDERISDPRRFSYFNTNAFPAINRRKSYRNKYTMGQAAVEVNLFELSDDEVEHSPAKLFSIDRVWDADENEYANFLDLDSYANPRKYMVVEDEGSVKLKFDFTAVGGEPPDFVVVEFAETEGLGANGIGADVEFQTAQTHPEIGAVSNLITSQGGADAKSAEEIKRLTGFFLRNHGVALSPGEIEYLARNFDSRINNATATKGVSRTASGLLPSVIVDVSLSPTAGIIPEERDYLLERLNAYLDSYTPINLHLEARWTGQV